MGNLEASGINLSAFGVTRRPMLATARESGGGEVAIKLQPAPGFDTRAKLQDSPRPLFEAWGKGLLEAARPVAVDIALAFAPLAQSDHLWRYTHRDIDFAFFGDAPLTDRVGEFGLRFRAWLAQTTYVVGKDVIEAMPRATVEVMEFKGQYRDGSAHYSKGAWKADDKSKRADKLMAYMLTELGVNPGQGAEKFNSDDFDAMICALTALGVAKGAPLLRGAELAAEVAARCERRADLPPGRLKGTVPSHVAVLAQPFWESIVLNRSA